MNDIRLTQVITGKGTSMYNNNLRSLLSGVLSLILCLGNLTACGLDRGSPSETVVPKQETGVFRTLDEIKESGTINIGVYSDKKPFCYIDEKGEYQGYDIYYAERIGRDLGVNINYITTDIFGRISNLETGKVDIVIANFTVTDERAQKVDFALPYMNVSLGVVSRETNVIKGLNQITADDEVVVIAGTMGETYLKKNNPDIKLQSFESRSEAMDAFKNGTGVAWVSDNTDVIKFAQENKGYKVGIPAIGGKDTIAAAVSKGNSTLLEWLNEEIRALGNENFFHADYEATLIDTFGAEYEEALVVEGGGENSVSTADLADIKPGHGQVIKVAASPVPHAQILAEAAKILGEYDYMLEIEEFDDYETPNLVVESGEFDANYAVHVPYIESFNQEHNAHIVDAGDIHYEPFGIYPARKKSLEDVAEGDRIAIPGDPSNKGRALLLLQDNGLITLDDSSSLGSSVDDIKDNPYNLEIVELEASHVAEAVGDVDYMILNGNYALAAGYSVGKDALARESSDSVAAKTYVNIIGVYAGNEESDKIKALVAVLRSDAIKKFIEETYDGSVVFFDKKN